MSGARASLQRPWAVALIGIVAVLIWQALTVHYNFAGNWSGLFCAGEKFLPPPAALEFEHTYRIPNSMGYDGQQYHIMAHDPFLTRGFQSSLDVARFRYRRIFVPLAAWTLALGQDRFIDFTYYALSWTAIFLGIWWTARMAVDQGMHAAWALLFLFTGGAVATIDRMLMDGVVLAEVAGVVYCASRKQWRATFVLAVVAALTREVGLVTVGGLVGWLAFERRFRLAAAMAAACVPAFAWYVYVFSRTTPMTDTFVAPAPFLALMRRIVTPFHYTDIPVVNVLSTVFDYCALAGLVWAIVYAAINFRPWLHSVQGWIGFAFVALIAVVSNATIYDDPYGYTRLFSPSIYITGIDGFRTRSWKALMPLALTAPRVGLLVTGQILRVVRGLAGL